MSEHDIKAGETYTLETTHGSHVRVKAESGVWENSKGIEGFDARLLEDFGASKAGDFYICQTHIFEVVDADSLGQCEGCGTLVTEADACIERYPGAILWFCEECADE